MRSFLLGLTAFFLLFSGSPMVGAERTWDGGGAGAGWQDADNWDGLAPVAGDALIFPTSTKKSVSNDFAAGTSFGPLTFNAGGYVVSGNQIDLNGGLFLNGGNAAQLGTALELVAPVAFTVSNSAGVLTVSQVVSGSGGIIKSGSGLLVLSATNTYAGETIIMGGGVQVSGSVAGRVQINSGYLVGTGTVEGITSLNQGVASIAPGTNLALGTLTSDGDVTLFGNDQLHFDVNGNASDKLTVIGSVNLALSDLLINVGTVPTLNTDLVLIDNDGTDPVVYDAANPSNYLASVVLNGEHYRVLFVGGTDRNDVVLRRVPSVGPSTVQLVSSDDDIAHGEGVTFSVQVSGSFGTPDGAVVSFWDGAEFIGTATLNALGQGQTPVITTLKPGERKITALFPGNANYAMTRSSNIVDQTVNGIDTTTSLVVTPASSPPGTSDPGESVTLEATVSPLGTGSITFFDGGVELATVNVTGNPTLHATTTLKAGDHSLSARFNPTGAYESALPSNTVVHRVEGDPTITTLTALPATQVVAGTDITFTATVTGGTPTGSVVFRDGAATLATVDLSGGEAELTISGLSAGTHSITALYLGSIDEQPSTSNTINQVITAAPDGSGSSGGNDVELSGGCGLGSGTAALLFGLLMLLALRLRRN